MSTRQGELRKSLCYMPASCPAVVGFVVGCKAKHKQSGEIGVVKSVIRASNRLFVEFPTCYIEANENCFIKL